MERNESIPYPELSKEWYFHRGKLALEENQLPYPKLSLEWYKSVGEKQQSEHLTDAYSCLSKAWYQRRGELYRKNFNRTSNAESKETNLETIALHITRLAEQVKSRTEKIEILALHEAVKFFSKNEPLVQVQDLIYCYRSSKSNLEQSYMAPSIFIKKLKKYGAFQMIQVFGKSYAFVSNNANFKKLSSNLNSIPENALATKINTSIEDKIGDLFKSSLKLATTKSDVDLIKGLFAKATSGKFTAKLMGVKNKTSTVSAKHQLSHKVSTYEEIEQTSKVVRNNMTNQQQYRLGKKIVAKRWQEFSKSQHDSRGRKLKITEFPELSMVLEQVFEAGEKSIGGGLESHPRLTCDTLFRSADNVLTMTEARKVILKVAPPGFTISLSSCYNYTNSYRINSRQAKQHHHGREINANISLKKPSRTLVSKVVANLHWTTKNVNLLLEEAEAHSGDYVIDSRDAKTVIPGDIQPVQLPGKSWKRIEVEDHSYDQSRDNAVYPMTHLLMNVSKVTDVGNGSEITERIVVRTGKPVAFVYAAFYEKETTFNAMNEFFRLCTVSQIDEELRKNNESRMKENLVLIVDNGHGEDPDSPLTKMCMIRILLFFNLKKITQRAFAEYHSKRNFVERVHAAENEVLSRHGPFSSKKIHSSAVVGSSEHKENIEAMATDVTNCLRKARFNQHNLISIRGGNAVLFDDEQKLRDFLAMTEEKKATCGWTYTVRNNELSNELKMLWGAKTDLRRKYYDDYVHVNNMGGQRTAWLDEYSTTIFNPSKNIGTLFEIQPIPDYIRWFKSKGELHYLTTEKTRSLVLQMKELQVTPGVFIPERLIQLIHTISPNPPEDVFDSIAFICWLPVTVVKKRFLEINQKMEKDMNDHIERAKWASHKLYSLKTDELRERCKKRKLFTKGLKHELVKRLAASEKLQEPGKISEVRLKNIPSNLTSIQKLPLVQLKHLLYTEGICSLGNKDELVLRVYLLKNNKGSVISFHIRRTVLNKIILAENIINEQFKQAILNNQEIRRKRRHLTSGLEKSNLHLTTVINKEDMLEVLKNLHLFIKNVNTNREATPKSSVCKNVEIGNESYFEVGATIKVKWLQQDLGVGYKPGWYTANVQAAYIEEDTINIVYISEPDIVYSMEVTPYIASGRIKLIS